MLEIRPDCERCGRDLPNGSPEASKSGRRFRRVPEPGGGHGALAGVACPARVQGAVADVPL